MRLHRWRPPFPFPGCRRSVRGAFALPRDGRALFRSLRRFHPLPQSGASGVVAAHPVDRPTGRGGGGADVEAVHGSRVGYPSEGGPEEELPEIHDAPADVTADQVGVVALQFGRRQHAPREDEVTEAGGKALDLVLDTRGHICRGAPRHMAVRPRGVLSPGSPRGIEQRGLREQHEGCPWVLALPRSGFRGRDLVKRTPEVHGDGPRALRGRPGDRAAERPIDLEDTGSVAVALKRMAIARGEAVAGDPQHLARRQVQENRTRRGQLVDVLYRSAGDDLASERAEVGGQRVGDALRAAAGDRPADGVSRDPECETECSRRRAGERHRGMRRHPGEESAGALALEGALRETMGRAEPAQAEARHEERMVRDPQRREHVRCELRPLLHERTHQLPPRAGVFAERCAGGLYRALQQRRRSVVEGVR
ncbi:hypothetical protein BH24GEM3_BH24GEM3_01180 [soil metagenome]